MMVIAMPVSVLVAHKSRAQDVKLVVSELKKKDIPQAKLFLNFTSPGVGLKSLTNKGVSRLNGLCLNLEEP